VLAGQGPFDRLRVTTYSRPPSPIERIFYGQIVTRLAEIRRAKGLTQEELDQALNVTEGQVAKWESFARLPGAFMMVCWSNALGVTLSLLEPDHRTQEEETCPTAADLEAEGLPLRRAAS